MHNKSRMTRWVAAPIHLGISAFLAAAMFAVIYFVWYPEALFSAAGGMELFLLIVMVDVTIGPLITLIIFVPGKKGLRFDLAVIAIVQLAALVYGVWVLYESRPVWIVYVKDRYELVRANEVDDADRAKAKPPYDGLSITGPKLVGAQQPANPDEQLHIIMTAMQGKDLQRYPQYFNSYDEARTQATAHAQSLAELRRLNPTQRAMIGGLAARYGRTEAQVGFLPLRAGKNDLTVLIDRKSGDVLGTYALAPWKY
jgi:hypothetical protein